MAWYGPIVMNTQQQLRDAFEELEQGTFLKQKQGKSRGPLPGHQLARLGGVLDADTILWLDGPELNLLPW